MSAFSAMGTTVTVVTPQVDLAEEHRLTAEVAALFESEERIFSRFRPDSELSQMNRATGRFIASEALFGALVRATEHTRATSGVFDPSIEAALLNAGYDRSFAPGRLDRDEPVASSRGRSCAAPAWRLDRETRAVELSPGVGLDLGGMIKGRAADRALALLPQGSAVDAGGDVALSDAGPEGPGFLVEVEDPREPSETLVTLRVQGGAVATSAANRRSWKRGGRTMHHLIDPRTGSPAQTDLAQTTVLAGSAEVAEVFAMVAFILGAEAGAAFLRAQGASALLVLRDRSLVEVGNLEVCDA